MISSCSFSMTYLSKHEKIMNRRKRLDWSGVATPMLLRVILFMKSLIVLTRGRFLGGSVYLSSLFFPFDILYYRKRKKKVVKKDTGDTYRLSVTIIFFDTQVLHLLTDEISASHLKCVAFLD